MKTTVMLILALAIVLILALVILLTGGAYVEPKTKNPDFDAKNQVFLYKADEVISKNYTSCVPLLYKTELTHRTHPSSGLDTVSDVYTYYFRCQEGVFKVSCDYFVWQGTTFDTRLGCRVLK